MVLNIKKEFKEIWSVINLVVLYKQEHRKFTVKFNNVFFIFQLFLKSNVE
jgi:hypothetical protein